MKSLTTLRELGKTDLHALILAASGLRESLANGGPVRPTLGGLCVANVFFEPSTRTRLSFDLAAQRLGAHVITFNPETSSLTKGESIQDTLLTVGAIGADILVVRHHEEGTAQSAADWTGLPVVNAGDGANEHPTQALLDVVTLHRHFGPLDGLRMAVIGDVAHSRVAGSLVPAAGVLGMEVILVGPDSMLPRQPEVAKSTDLDEVLDRVDIVYLLRVQSERGGVAEEGYIERFRLDQARAARLADHTVVMHPGPMNRGVEITTEVAASPRSLIREQVRNGVPTRMAVFEELVGR